MVAGHRGKREKSGRRNRTPLDYGDNDHYVSPALFRMKMRAIQAELEARRKKD